MNIFKRASQALMQGPIYVILFGLIFFGIGGGLTYKQFFLQQDALQTTGEVTGYSQSCDDEGCTYKSVVHFVTQEGKSISYTTGYSSSPPAHDIGEKVIVFYNPQNPAKAVLKGEGGVFRFIFMGVGGAIMLFGLGFFASTIKNSYLEEES